MANDYIIKLFDLVKLLKILTKLVSTKQVLGL